MSKKSINYYITMYKLSNSKLEKNEIFKEFMKVIWSNPNKRQRVIKKVSFFIDKNLYNEQFVELFNTYSNIEYVSYKSRCKNTSYDYLLRQKINNVYTNMCDGKVCIYKDYMDLIHFPKSMYYKYQKGIELDYDTTKLQIEESLLKATRLKEQYAKRKLKLPWGKYKILVEGYLRRCFENVRLLEDIPYEEQTLDFNASFISADDNYYVRYFCVSLERYFMVFQKKYYKIYNPSTTKNNIRLKRCLKCGCLYRVTSAYDRKSKYCKQCSPYHKLEEKNIICLDCGKDFKVKGDNKRTVRCEQCTYLHNKMITRERVQKYRTNQHA